MDNQQKTIMVVDDEETIQTFFEMFLKRAGYNVVVLPSGASALTRLRTKGYKPVDLLVLDLMMPGPGGYEVIKELQKPEFNNVPVLIVTARTLDPGTIQMMQLESNVQGFFTKPVDMDKFKKKIYELIGPGNIF